MYLLFPLHVRVLYYCPLLHLNLSLYFFTIRSSYVVSLYLTLKFRVSGGLVHSYFEELTEKKKTSDKMRF